MSEATQNGKPGRYQRTTGGLIGSMIVLVLAVFALVIFRGAFRDTPEYEPEDIDYREMVASIQQLGLEPVYPPTLPAGWTAKDASFESGARPVVDLVFATADKRTAGVHQEDAAEQDLLGRYVGDEATETRETLRTPLATWTGWRDTDDDHAWTAEIGEETVLVYSSGDPDQLRALVESLTQEQLAP